MLRAIQNYCASIGGIGRANKTVNTFIVLHVKVMENVRKVFGLGDDETVCAWNGFDNK